MMVPAIAARSSTVPHYATCWGLKDDTITEAETHECTEIHLGPNFSVAGPNGSLTATAGDAGRVLQWRFRDDRR